ncbi:putative C-S lyase [Ruficoccus amylovorans]|uniref:cysteine-S-conjugate beta-lyase n=1 Tax=Ruficoccus amylovorans TaxID=1804625 RepID=A0A842HMD8_9BACT|nr:PatB family C-S lyase [Ruficoccus amylovorans]MBC2596251.1 putative C-S lyase [Ruficoccus amylovorans]
MFDFDQVIDRTGTGSLKWGKYTGRDVLPLWVADMDFASPQPVLEALRRRVEHGIFGYTLAPESTQEAVLAYLKRVHGYEAKREWLVWLPGLVPALNVVARAFGEPEDEVLTCTPVYPPFLSAPGWQAKKLVTSPLKLEGGEWTFDFDDLEAKVTPRTRAFILCNPHNPVGRVYRPEELKRIVAFCEKHDLVLCSDEIHCDLLFDGYRHTVTATLSPEAERRTITLMAPSKTYNLPGLCCSFAVIADPKLRLRFQQAARGMITEVNCLGYAGCEAAYNEGEPWRLQLMEYLTANRDLLYRFVQERLPEITLRPMEATYLAWLNIEGLRELGCENPHRLFEEHGVGLSPGADFQGPDCVRLNFGCTRAMLEQALLRMEAAVTTLR